MPRIAMVTPYPVVRGLLKGGVETVAYNLCRELAEMPQVDLHVVAPYSLKNTYQIEMRDGITIHSIPQSKLPGFISYWTTGRRAIHKCLHSIDPDIVHFQGVAGWALGYKRPYVLTIHGIAEKDILFSDRRGRYLRHKVSAWVERAGRKACANTIIISPYVVQELNGQIKGSCWSIENPVAQEFFDVPNLRSGKRILYVGRINERKNVTGLIRAFRLLRQRLPDVELRIGGPLDEGAYGSECMGLARDLGLSDSTTFLGPLSRDVLLSELSQASCLALVSHQETAPMVVEEAMASGVPVVASRICGVPYIINDGKTGFLVDQDDASDIAEKLYAVLVADEQSAFSMSAECKKVALERFHSKIVAAKTMDVYQRVLA